MNIDMSSVIKAGGIAAGVGLLLAVLSSIPYLGCLFVPLLCLGLFLIPFGAGLGYGYWAPGKETMGQSAFGGALAGGFSGLVYGIVRGIVGAILNTGLSAMEGLEGVPGSVGGGVAEVLILACVSVIGGIVLGGLGGIVWPLVQGNRT